MHKKGIGTDCTLKMPKNVVLQADSMQKNNICKLTFSENDYLKNKSENSCSDPELKKLPCFEPFVWTQGSCNEGDYCRKNQPVLSELERKCRVSWTVLLKKI